MFSYQAYGLGIRSDFVLVPGTERKATKDVIIQRRSIPRWFHAAEHDTPHVDVTADEARAYWPDLGALRIRRGSEIVVDPIDGIDTYALLEMVDGPGLAAVLHQRGRLVLHGSAVGVEGQAVAFLADSGHGKSTLAAALHNNGHQLIADDVTAIQMHSSHLVYPGFPRIRIRTDSASALGASTDELARLRPELQKHTRRLAHGFAASPLPLGCIYLLAEGERYAFETITPSAGLVALVRHSYVPALVQVPETRAMHFRQVTELVNQVPIRRLIRPRSLSRLTELVRAVENDILS